MTNNCQTIDQQFSLKMIYEKCSSNISSSSEISHFNDLALDIIREIFDYLTIGNIYYSFYHINKFYKEFIDKSFPCLNLISMSYRHLIFYSDQIVFNNTEHCNQIKCLKLTNEKPFDHLRRFYPFIDLYTNLEKLYLNSPNIDQLELIPILIPHLSQLDIIIDNGKSLNIKWLSALQKLQKCSIEGQQPFLFKIFSSLIGFVSVKRSGIEIDHSVRSLSPVLSSFSITLCSTYDFDRLLPLLSSTTLQRLDISLSDNQYFYMKTFRNPISLARELSEFSFDMSLKLMFDPLSLYGIIRFVSSTLRYVKTLTIISRFRDGIFIDEDKLRRYFSFLYSVENYKLFLEMTNRPTSIINAQPTFDESAYDQPFWIEKGIRLNIYRNSDEQIKRVRISTLPLISKISNYLDSNDSYQLIKSTVSSNINRFLSKDLNDSIDLLTVDQTLTPNRIQFSSNITLLFHLSSLSAFSVEENDLSSFVKIFSRNPIYPNIRRLHLANFPNSLTTIFDQIFQIFPSLQSLSLEKIDQFNLFSQIFQNCLLILPERQMFIQLRIRGLYFDEICPEYYDDEQLKMTLMRIFNQSSRKNSFYDLTMNRFNRSIDIWF